MDVVAAVLRLPAVWTGVIVAAAMWSAPAHADPPDVSNTDAASDVGLGNNGQVSDTIAGIGQSICPMLVKPGAKLGSAASQMTGSTGLSPDIAGFLTGMAVQMECPGFMTSLANGDVPFPLQSAGADPAPAVPFRLPGANPVPPMPGG
jgi:hypothetical protein